MIGGFLKFGFVAALGIGLQLGSVGGVVAQTPTPSSDLRTTGGYSSSFRIGGAVGRPTTFTLKDLQALPPTSANVYYSTGKGPVSAKYTGVLLWDLLNQVGIKTDASIKNDILRRFIVVTATDGYAVYISAGELSPMFGGHQVLVAYAQDDQLLGTDSGFSRLVFPGDKAGGRYVSWIKAIQVH
ncbi:molybdopterin-dependent oxidoreductase [Methylocapsa aurea]|uniref:molybdopterin-dependent oxidoreductase n=1 Tax=Methylocapsa aurea TaxID=663610 RepID=UPI00138E2615|nr:molybdopterin-dependent oxidoreductase [Methylocapsa aurea]